MAVRSALGPVSENHARGPGRMEAAEVIGIIEQRVVTAQRPDPPDEARQREMLTLLEHHERRTASVSGEQLLRDGRRIELTATSLAAPLDGALSVLSLAVVLLAAAAVVLRA